mmetsp:Transcript_3636/g.10117  ORF Transcript_3636/g.10117 Transcript_3636/m.10117 type:complete len:214 (-) Transcript_3636:23-664(-)
MIECATSAIDSEAGSWDSREEARGEIGVTEAAVKWCGVVESAVVHWAVVLFSLLCSVISLGKKNSAARPGEESERLLKEEMAAYAAAPLTIGAPRKQSSEGVCDGEALGSSLASSDSKSHRMLQDFEVLAFLITAHATTESRPLDRRAFDRLDALYMQAVIDGCDELEDIVEHLQAQHWKALHRTPLAASSSSSGPSPSVAATPIVQPAATSA